MLYAFSRNIVGFRDHLAPLRKLAGAAMVALVLGGCLGMDGGAGAGDTRAMLPGDPALLVATTRRAADPRGERPFFGPGRGNGLSFARARMAPPADGLAARVTNLVSGGWRVTGIEGLSKA